MPTEEREFPYTATEVPRPACGRCDDWTTVVVKNIISPCPLCRPAEYQAWLAARGSVPSQ